MNERHDRAASTWSLGKRILHDFGVFDDRGAGACTKSKTRTLARYTERALYYRMAVFCEIVLIHIDNFQIQYYTTPKI
jgi:hypothetical protein